MREKSLMFGGERRRRCGSLGRGLAPS